MTFHLNTDKTAAVASDTYYLPMSSCPKGVRIIGLSKWLVARIDVYNGNTTDLIGWAPLPRIPPELKQV